MSKEKIFSEWKSYFLEKGLAESLSDAYLLYINKLLNNNVPIIFNFSHLCLLLGRKPFYLASLINSPQNHYFKFKLPKRSGGFREINAPMPSLIEIQNWIYINILLKYPVDPSAHGFVKKKSIITNSKIHIGQNQLLKLDLKDFFPSIHKNRVIAVFKKFGYPIIVSNYLASMCCLNDQLPQGAPTSPYLSNIIASKLDKRLFALAKFFRLRYTRYADDLTFSGDIIPAKLIDYIDNIISNEGFEINKQKTRLYKTNRKKIVTGISLNTKELRLPKKYKRQLKMELFYIFKYGIYSHVSKKKIKKPNYINSILGKVAFWLSIEPKNKFALESKTKLLALIN